MIITKDHYLYCIDCDMVIDWWKYLIGKNSTQQCLQDAHENCILRNLTDDEYVNAVEVCKKGGCFDEL